MAFGIASKKAQSAASRIRFEHTGDDVESLTLSQQRENLVHKKKALADSLRALNAQWQTKEVVLEVQSKKQELHVVESQIIEINKKLYVKKLLDPRHHFMEVAKERLSLYDYKMFMEEAWRRARAEAEKEESAK